MASMTPREILDAIHEGLEETALLVSLGYDALQGRPGRKLLNDSLEQQGYGRPIGEYTIDPLQPYRPYPDDWIKAIATAVSGNPTTPLRDVAARLRQRLAEAS
jgi:hypothetical protein